VEIHVRPIRTRVVETEMAAELERELLKDLQLSGEEVKEYLRKIVESWKNEVDFRATKKVAGDEIKVGFYAIGPGREIFHYVNMGTEPHPIRPKKAGGSLAFMWGGPGSYVPKTGLSGQYKGPGEVVGGSLQLMKAVQHPGTKARRFDKAIHRWHKPKFDKRIRRTINRVGMRARRRGISLAR